MKISSVSRPSRGRRSIACAMLPASFRAGTTTERSSGSFRGRLERRAIRKSERQRQLKNGRIQRFMKVLRGLRDNGTKIAPNVLNAFQSASERSLITSRLQLQL